MNKLKQVWSMASPSEVTVFVETDSSGGINCPRCQDYFLPKKRERVCCDCQKELRYESKWDLDEDSWMDQNHG